MMQKSLRITITLLSTLSILFNSVAYASAAYYGDVNLHRANTNRPLALSGVALDPDFDGIPTSQETNGWVNDLGGPYYTDPNNSDTDNDGLTDGQEQLFDTDPTDARSPGIFVEYTTDLHTEKYFVWQKHGSKTVAHTQDTDKDGLVVRRGASFVVYGPPDATLTVKDTHNAGLTMPSISSQTCGAGWQVNVAGNSTVGIYTLEMNKSGWSQPVTMPLYVIFDFPDPQNTGQIESTLTEPLIETMLYDDDLTDNRDEHVVWWGTKDTSGKYKLSRGRSIAFPTDQYEAYVFEDHVMPTINGQTRERKAAEAILKYIDQNTVFNASVNHYTMKDALHSAGTLNQCSNLSNMATGFARGAGIPARSMNVDWDDVVINSGYFDHAVQFWVNNEWQTGRAYIGHLDPCNDGGDCAINPRSASSWPGIGHTERKGDLIYTSPPNWSWETTGDEGDTDNEVNALYPFGWDYVWIKPTYPNGNVIKVGPISEGLFRTGSIELWDVPYWGWANEPPTTTLLDEDRIADPEWPGCPGYPCYVDGKPKGDGVETDSIEDFSTNRSLQSPELALDEIQTSYGVDSDGDGRFNQLVVEVAVSVTQPGNYTFGASLGSVNGTPDSKSGALDTTLVSEALEAGSQVVQFTFEGQMLARHDDGGPYLLTDVWASPTPPTADSDMIDESMVAYEEVLGYVVYQSPAGGQLSGAAASTSSDFDNWGAELSPLLDHTVQDLDEDGHFDRLTVNTTLEISDPGEYRVEAELVDSQGETVAEAGWTGSGSDVSLVFEALLADPHPYHVKNIYLYNAKDEIIDVLFDGYRSPGSYLVGPLYNSGLGAFSAEDLAVTGVQPQYLADDNTVIEALEFTVEANITAPGNYRVEGWLENSAGHLIAWRTGDLTAVSTIGTHTFKLSFDGKSINASRMDGPYKLTALKVAKKAGNSYVSNEEVDVAFTTQDFAFTQFDDANAQIDRMENGEPSDLWATNINDTTWALTEEAAASPTHSWTDSPGGPTQNGTALLTTKTFSVGKGAVPVVSFHSCHALGADQGQVQIKVNNDDWTPIADDATYSGQSTGWTVESFTGSPIGSDNNTVSMRFRLDVDAGGDEGWYVDDVSIFFYYDINGDGRVDQDTDGDGKYDFEDPDDDGDGISDKDEGYNPDDPDNSVDTDGDGLPDHLDTDSDGDSIADEIEGNVDSDGDGIPDFRDPDSDNNGINDEEEDSADTDQDGKPDYLDDDNDGDGFLDEDEWFGPDDPRNDIDGDGVPNHQDTDSDNNGVSDKEEGGADLDQDGTPDYLDDDNDGDGLLDSEERLDPDDPDAAFCSDRTADTDGDGVPNCLDNDIDGDGLPNYEDTDSDGDGLSDSSEAGKDSDGDGIPDPFDGDNPKSENIIHLPLITK